jgi:hypothetical protein
MDNPLIAAVVSYEGFIQQVNEVAEAMGGEALYGDAVYDMAHELVYRAWESTFELSFRASRARMNALWREFLDEQKKREAQ